MFDTLRRALLVVALSTSAQAAEPGERGISTEGDWVFQDNFIASDIDRPLQTAGGVTLGGGIGAMTASVALFWMSSNAHDQAMSSCDVHRCVASDADHFFGVMQRKQRSAQITLGSGAAVATAGIIMVLADASRHRRRELARAEAGLIPVVSFAPKVPSIESPSPGLVFGIAF